MGRLKVRKKSELEAKKLKKQESIERRRNLKMNLAGATDLEDLKRVINDLIIETIGDESNDDKNSHSK